MFLGSHVLTADNAIKTDIDDVARKAQLVRHYVPHEIQDAVARIVAVTYGDYTIEPPISMFGKVRPQPRDVQFRSDESKGYFYSGGVAEALPLNDDMRFVIAWANTLVGAEYNGILINRYKDGTKSVGAHADSEAGLDPSAGVLAISYGATRKFRIRDKHTKQLFKDVPARQGEAIQMKGDFQSWFHHEIPKEPSVLGERISLTFRRHDVVKERKLWEQRTRNLAAKKRAEDSKKARQQEVRADPAKVEAERATLKRPREEQEEE